MGKRLHSGLVLFQAGEQRESQNLPQELFPLPKVFVQQKQSMFINLFMETVMFPHCHRKPKLLGEAFSRNTHDDKSVSTVSLLSERPLLLC